MGTPPATVALPCRPGISQTRSVLIPRDELTRPPSGLWAYSRNSKTPCLPEFLPVITPVQATGLSGGKTDPSVPDAPFSIRRDRFGRSPDRASGPITSHVAPSRPSTNTFIACFPRRPHGRDNDP